MSEKNLKEAPTDLSGDAVEEISSNLRRLLADVFVLYVKTKNFHWHISGRHFRDYHLLLDEQSTQIFAMTDEIAERARKIGGTTIRSITDIAKNQRLKDNNKEMVSPQEMIGELYADNQQLTRSLRATHAVCDRHNDLATASLIENWIDESERRAWFLSEFLQGAAAASIALSAPFAAKASGKTKATPAGSLAPTPIWPGGVEKPLMPYTPALKAAGWLFIAGQLASDFETGVAPQAISNGSDAERLALQTRFVMPNVAKTVAAAGLDFGRDTARLWQWLTSPYPTAEEFARGDNWPRIPTSALFSERATFLQSPGPISTSMGVKALMVKDTMLEVDLIGVDDGTSNEGFESPVPTPGQASVIRRGDWVFLSSESWQRTPVSGGTEQQADQILSLLAKLAEKAGASLRRTVKAEVYIGHPSEYAAMEAAWKRWFPKNPPARVVMPYMGLTGGRGRRIEIALTLLADNSRKTIDTVHTDKAPQTFSHEPQAVKAGNLLFLSQQMAFDSKGKLAAGMARNPNFPYYGQPSRQQMAYMLKNVAAICEAAGSSLENVVKRVCFHDDGQNFAEAMSEWADHFPGLKPASTTLVVGGPLVVAGAHTLLDITAYVP